MPGCRGMSTHIEKWMKRAVSQELQKNLSSFSTSIEFRDDNRSFYFGKKT